MTTKQQEEMNKRFDELFSNRKVVGDRTFKDYCEYLYSDILDFLQSEIDLAIAEERKRKAEIITNYFNERNFDEWNSGELLSLITKDN